MRKKLMSLLLIGTMTTLLFTGCGGGSSEKETSKSNLIRLLKLKRNGIVKLTGLTLDGMESKTVLTHQ